MKETCERLKRDRKVVVQTLKAIEANHEAKRLSTESFERLRAVMERELLSIDENLWAHGERTCE